MISRIVIALIATIVSTSAFKPSGRAALGNLMMAKKEGMSESLPFLPEPANLEGMAGNVGFDPVGFSSNFDVRWLREAELKHARICMLAVVGFVTADFVQLPGDIHQVSSALAHDVAVRSGAFGQVFLWISIFELLSVKAMSEMYEGSGREPGDYGFDPLRLSENKSDEVKMDYANKELANGRLAMMAISGIVTQAVLTGHGFPYV